MKAYTTHFQTTATPQAEPIPGTSQVPNSAGGFAWPVDDWTRLQRFLVLGTEGGSYYASEKTLTVENAQAVVRCLQVDWKRTVDTIVAISEAGRAPKNDPAIFALAMVAGMAAPEGRTYALSAMPKVCRIGTHLFHFAQAVQGFRGWGRGLRRAVAAWYQQEVERLAYQMIKYAQRDGWSHRDLLCLSHPVPPSTAHAALYDWIVRGKTEKSLDGLRFVEGVERLKQAADPTAASILVREYRLPREAIESVNTAWLNDRALWAALLEEMPLEAMTRNLGVMTARGLIAPMSDASAYVVSRFSDRAGIHKARLHPIKLLAALLTYQGGSSKGGLTWTPVQQVVDALDAAFYLAFENVEPTGKRLMLALDVSGSMSTGIVAGVAGLTPRVAAAAMALVTAARESNHVIVAFQSKSGQPQSWRTHHRDDGIVPLHISPRQRLDDVVEATNNLPFGGTDCALPMLYAIEQKLLIDGFIILTDSETWAGAIHPAQALIQYRRQTGLPAKLVVVGMVSNGFSIADPNDAGMMDVVGFDTTTPALIADFVGEGIRRQAEAPLTKTAL